MKLVCVWRDNTEYAREMSNWIADFERTTGMQVESLDPDTIEGESFARAHDIVEYPTLMAVDNNGAELHQWRGRPLPSFDQVSYYARPV